VSGLSPDERLLQDALSGAAGARRELAGRLMDAIQREVGFVLGRWSAGQSRDPRQELRDLVQEVLLSLFEHDCRELRRWDPQRGRSLDSFVRLIARRKAARILGQKKGNPWAEQPLDPSSIESDEVDAEADALLRRLEHRDELGAVLDMLHAHMRPRDFELFDLLFVQERDPVEVAEALNMTRGAVNAWRYRTRKLARACALETIAGLSSPGPTIARGVTSHE
jgi:RNA polymerase sigma factor (sigma-70 family)